MLSNTQIFSIAIFSVLALSGCSQYGQSAISTDNITLGTYCQSLSNLHGQWKKNEELVFGRNLLNQVTLKTISIALEGMTKEAIKLDSGISKVDLTKISLSDVRSDRDIRAIDVAFFANRDLNSAKLAMKNGTPSYEESDDGFLQDTLSLCKNFKTSLTTETKQKQSNG